MSLVEKARVERKGIVINDECKLPPSAHLRSFILRLYIARMDVSFVIFLHLLNTYKHKTTYTIALHLFNDY